MKKKIIYFAGFLFIGFLTLVQLFLSNRLTAEGRKLELLQNKISQTKEENNHLKTEIASGVGLSKLSLVASKKGFIKNPLVINMTNRASIAVFRE